MGLKKRKGLEGELCDCVAALVNAKPVPDFLQDEVWNTHHGAGDSSESIWTRFSWWSLRAHRPCFTRRPFQTCFTLKTRSNENQAVDEKGQKPLMFYASKTASTLPWPPSLLAGLQDLLDQAAPK